MTTNNTIREKWNEFIDAYCPVGKILIGPREHVSIGKNGDIKSSLRFVYNLVYYIESSVNFERVLIV